MPRQEPGAQLLTFSPWLMSTPLAPILENASAGARQLAPRRNLSSGCLKGLYTRSNDAIHAGLGPGRCAQALASSTASARLARVLSISLSVVNQLQTDTRMTRMTRQVAPPNQATPLAWTRLTTSS